MPDAASHPRMDGEAENAGRRRPEGICRHSVKSGSSEAWRRRRSAAEAWGCFRVSGGRFRHGCHCAPPPHRNAKTGNTNKPTGIFLSLGKLCEGAELEEV